MDLIFEQEWDGRLICLFQSMILKWPFLKGLFILFTTFGEPFFLVLVCGFLYFGYRKRCGTISMMKSDRASLFQAVTAAAQLRFALHCLPAAKAETF